MANSSTKKPGDFKPWIAKAEADFEAAKILARSCKPGMPDLACYHYQQCAEKYLKAYLTFHRIQFPKTHDLENLLNLSLPADPLINALQPNIAFLNPYSVTARYPGEEVPVSESKKALKHIKSLRKFLRDRLSL